MGKSTEILHLIRSLSRPEKRYCKLQWSKLDSPDDKETNFIELFDDLNQYKGDTEEDFCLQHTGKRYLDNLSFNKTFLMSKIVAACLQMQNEAIDHTLGVLLAEARFYRDRRLLLTFSKKLSKAERLAEKYEKHEVLLEVLRMKRSYYMEGRPHDHDAVMQVVDKMVAVAKIIENKYTCLRIKDILFLEQKSKARERSPAQLKELEDLFMQPIMQDPAMALSFDAKHSCFFAKAIYYQLIGDWQASMTCHAEIFKLWKDNPPIREDRPIHYRNMLNNYLNMCCSNSRYDDFDEALAYMEHPDFLSEDERIETLQNSLYIRLTHEIGQCNWHQVAVVIAKYKHNQTAIEKKIHVSRKMAFYLHFAWCEFVNQRYKEASEWVEEILRSGKANVRDDIRNFALLFKPIIRIEQNYEDLLETDTKAASRYLGSQKDLLEYEKAVIQYYNKYPMLLDDQVKTKAAKALMQTLETLSQSKTSQNALGFEILLRWLESRIRKIDLRAIVEEKWLRREI